YLVKHYLFCPARGSLGSSSTGPVWAARRKKAMKQLRTFVWIAAGLVVLVVFPFVFPNPAVTTVAVFTLLFAAAATGGNVFSGYSGYISLGHATYLGIGSYALAIMCQDWNIAGGYVPFLLV